MVYFTFFFSFWAAEGCLIFTINLELSWFSHKSSKNFYNKIFSSSYSTHFEILFSLYIIDVSSVFRIFVRFLKWYREKEQIFYSGLIKIDFSMLRSYMHEYMYSYITYSYFISATAYVTCAYVKMCNVCSKLTPRRLKYYNLICVLYNVLIYDEGGRLLACNPIKKTSKIFGTKCFLFIVTAHLRRHFLNVKISKIEEKNWLKVRGNLDSL